ncbi:MAG: tetratricopeptide repeat protein [Anaerolineae bacterium]|nr:tetratricopeptide repeat protein [Anaerolineae bacterium]
MTPASNLIVHVNENNFQYEVISFSQNTPVVVDFWAPWSRNCRVMSPMLERLVHEAQGSFRLAKVNVDENPNLSLFYNVRSVPTIKAISFGNVIYEYVGIIPEAKIREMIVKLSDLNTENLVLERANNQLWDGEWVAAESSFREFLKNDPNQPTALLGLAKSLIAQNKVEPAGRILDHFPVSRLSSQANLLLEYVNTMQQFLEQNLPTTNELDNTFIAAIRLAHMGNVHAALDGLLEIIKTDKNYRDGKARAIFLSILEWMGSDTPTMREYRNELANTLF